jgi:peptidoglycan/xylan/chitin deacetylase (PgdA/CDA1 family)
MYRKELYTGADLPSKFLCLTYDDGPGKHTYGIAKFLYDQNIQATFFVVGKYAFHHHDILEKVSALGHLIGNHTYEHPDMPYYLSMNGDVQNQILRTDAIIKKYIKENTVYFRSPYGKWSQEVANELNLNILSAINHIGPIHWDVSGVDCFYWKNGHTVEDTVKKYLNDIKEKDRGIVVMHDEIADMNYLKDRNNTLELTKQLIPLLKLQGYKFVRLDEIESIKKDASKVFKFTLRSTNGKYVSLSESENNTVNVDRKQNSILNQLSMEDLGHGKIALKASNGLFFSLQVEKGNVIEATSTDIKEFEAFDLIPLSSNQAVLRAYNGNYLTKESRYGGKLLASAEYMRGAEIFSFSPVNIRAKKNIAFRERYKSLKRQILYIRSKIQQGI